LRTGLIPDNIQNFNLYLNGNILLLRYKEQAAMLCREITDIYCENRKKNAETLLEQNPEI
jgi:hypothetical protein